MPSEYFTHRGTLGESGRLVLGQETVRVWLEAHHTCRHPYSDSSAGICGRDSREACRESLSPEVIRGWQYVHGADPSRVSPDGYMLDITYMARPGADEIQLDLILDYRSNVALYPAFQSYFRERQPSFLAAWGKNDPAFIPVGARAYKRDLPKAEVHLLDTGHFALETHAQEIGQLILDFLGNAII